MEGRKYFVEHLLCINYSATCFSYAYSLTIKTSYKGRDFSFFFFNYFYLFIFGCVGSSLLCMGFLQLRQAGATLHCSARASHCSGFSCCGAQALGVQAQQLWLMGYRAQAQQLWHTGLVAPWHVGSSWTSARTCVPCIGRQILNHCATREVQGFLFTSEKTEAH